MHATTARPRGVDRSGQRGFTLVELLVVVTIIGVLAAIAVPVFLSQRQKAHVAALQGDVRNMAVAQMNYFVGRGGFSATLGGLRDEGFRPSNAGSVEHGVCAVLVGGNRAFVVGAAHADVDEIWVLDSSDMMLSTSTAADVTAAMQDAEASCTPDVD